MDPEDAINQDQDIVAVYTRFTSQSFQIRIDLLELDDISESDIYIALDTNPGGNPGIKTDGNGYLPSDLDWDYLIKVPASMEFNILNAQYKPSVGMETFIVVDPAQDRMVISLPRNYLPIYMGRTNIQVFITPNNIRTISDKSDPVAIDASPPPRAIVLFAFWNTLSAASPAETLRSWAGAHSGPMSSRHGLEYLLDAADRTNTTIFLMDTLTPDNLSALDYLQAMPRIRSMLNREVLVFFEFDHNPRVNTRCRKGLLNLWFGNNQKSIFDLFELKESMFDNKCNVLFMGGNGYAQLTKIKTDCNGYISNGYIHDSHDSISPECKKSLLMHAFTQPPTPLLLGGDFSNTLLGNPSGSLALFSYIQEHPWIQVLTAQDVFSYFHLFSVNAIQYHENQPYWDGYEGSVTDVQEAISRSLVLAPENPISALAFRTYANMTQPVTPDLLALSPNYIGQIGEILQAAQWADQPTSIETCNIDLDYDGSPECILSNENIFAVIEPQGGYIPFMFSSDDQGVHQIIGPTWEFMLGISDISTWNRDLGARADNKQILGAFQDQFSDWNSYTPMIKKRSIDLLSDDLKLQKSISLSSYGIHVEIRDNNQIHGPIYIPLVIDPWLRYLPGWGNFYQANSSSSAYLWGINDGVTVEIDSNAPYIAYSFKDSQTLILKPENPNFNYPPGHYLPYPMSLLDITPSASNSIDIHLK